MADRFRSIVYTIDMPIANTEYEVPIPKDSVEILMRLDNPLATWRYSHEQGVVAAGGGFPLDADERLPIAGPSSEQVIYVASDTAGVTLHLAYGEPYRTRP